MTKHETIDYKMLKAIMKLSIAIRIELSFYLSLDASITINRYEKCATDTSKTYYFELDNAENILRLVHAYAKLFNRYMHIC